MDVTLQMLNRLLVRQDGLCYHIVYGYNAYLAAVIKNGQVPHISLAHQVHTFVNGIAWCYQRQIVLIISPTVV